jgi:hypothetical protein
MLIQYRRNHDYKQGADYWVVPGCTSDRTIDVVHLSSQRPSVKTDQVGYIYPIEFLDVGHLIDQGLSSTPLEYGLHRIVPQMLSTCLLKDLP